MLARQSTALTLIVGPILDSTGAEYASAVIGDLSISKNGGTLTALAAAATLTYIANGQYTLVLTTGNTDTLGAIQITCNKSTYQMAMIERNVIPASVYDALVVNATNTTGGLPAATGAISALAGAISTLTQTQVSGGAYALNSSSFAFNAALDFTTTQKAATLARVTLVDTVTTLTNLPTIPANWITAAGIAASALNGKGDWLLAGSYTTPPTAVSIRQEIDTNSVGLAAIYSALTAFTGTSPAGWITSATFADNAITASVLKTDAVDKIADHIYNETTAGHDLAGTFGQLFQTTIPDAIDAVPTVGEIQSGTSLADLATMVTGDGTGGAKYTVAALENAPAGGGAGDPWPTELPGDYTAGQAGYIVGTLIPTLIQSLSAASLAASTTPLNGRHVIVRGAAGTIAYTLPEGTDITGLTLEFTAALTPQGTPKLQASTGSGTLIITGPRNFYITYTAAESWSLEPRPHVSDVWRTDAGYEHMFSLAELTVLQPVRVRPAI